MKLNLNEKIIIYILRKFDTFLSLNGFSIRAMSYMGPGEDYMIYESRKNIEIYFDSTYADNKICFNIVIEKVSIFRQMWEKAFSLAEIIKEINNDQEIETNISNEEELKKLMDIYLHYMKEYLMPVIKGEMWIDKLMKKIS